MRGTGQGAPAEQASRMYNAPADLGTLTTKENEREEAAPAFLSQMTDYLKL